MGPVEPNSIVNNQQQSTSQKPKQQSRSNERTSRQQKTRRTSRSRSGDRDSSSSSSGNNDDDDEENRSMDDDDDATVSDRSSRESSSAKQNVNIRWDFRMNSVGKRVKDTKAFCCLNCQYPVLLVGRLVPCKHSAYCLQCANNCKSAHRNCPKCNEAIQKVEEIEAKNLILCHHGSHPHSQDACLRGYTSQRDLQAHIKRRHEQPPPLTQPPPPQQQQTRLESPHPLKPPAHPSPVSFPGLVVESQAQTPQQQGPPTLPPPLMNFPPMNVPGLPPPPPPPPLFDMGFRAPNYGMPHPQQQFVPPSQQQYRPPPYPPNRPFY